jgi:hypothetical protein
MNNIFNRFIGISGKVNCVLVKTNYSRNSFWLALKKSVSFSSKTISSCFKAAKSFSKT